MVKYILYTILLALAINTSAQRRPIVFDRLVEFQDSITLNSEQIGQWSDIKADSALYADTARYALASAGTSDSSLYADTSGSAYSIIPEYETTRTIYVDSAAGSDITGDGTIGQPFKTLLKGIQDIKDILIDVDVTINLSAGGYVIDGVKEECTRLEVYNSTIEVLGEYTLLESGFTMVRDATENFKFTLTKVGKTFTTDEFKHKWASNGSRYYVCRGNTSGADNVTMRSPDDRSNNSFYEDAVYIRQSGVSDLAFNFVFKVSGGLSKIIFNKVKIETGSNLLQLDNNNIPIVLANVFYEGAGIYSTLDNLWGVDTKGDLTIHRSCIVGTSTNEAINITGGRFSFKMHGTYISNDIGIHQVVNFESCRLNDLFANMYEGNMNIQGIRFKNNNNVGLGQNNVFMNCLAAIEFEDENIIVFDAGIQDEALRFELIDTDTLFDCTTADQKPPKSLQFNLDELYFDTDTNYFTGGTSEFVNIDKGVIINIPDVIQNYPFIMKGNEVDSIMSGVIPDTTWVGTRVDVSGGDVSKSDSTVVFVTPTQLSDYVDTLAGLVSTDSLKIIGSLITPFETESFSSSKTIDFSDNSFKNYTVTGTTTINITNINEGVNTLWLKQNATGYVVTIGTGWGDPFDGTGTLGNTANANYIIQFIYDGTDILYGIIIEGE